MRLTHEMFPLVGALLVVISPALSRTAYRTCPARYYVRLIAPAKLAGGLRIVHASCAAPPPVWLPVGHIFCFRGTWAMMGMASLTSRQVQPVAQGVRHERLPRGHELGRHGVCRRGPRRPAADPAFGPTGPCLGPASRCRTA